MIIVQLLQVLLVLSLAMLSVAFFSLYERKLMAFSQLRVGPGKVVVGGNLQPIADAVKLVSKTQVHPNYVNPVLYYFSPFLAFIIPLMVWGLLPMKWGMISLNMGMVILLIYFSVSVYSLILCGWFSNSKYAFLGSVRAISQSISYEIGLTLILSYMCIVSSSFGFNKILYMQELVWTGLSHILLMGLLVISLLAETNRSPFDLTEGESELVSGYTVEYGGLSYTLIFLGENLSILWACFVVSVLFGNLTTISSFSTVSLFVLLRALLPRSRYDSVMYLFWLRLLPLTLGVCVMKLFLST